MYSQLSISSFVISHVGKYENIPSSCIGIRSSVPLPSAVDTIQWLSLIKFWRSMWILGTSFTFNPAYIITNGGIKLFIIEYTYNPFFTTIMNVSNVWGQSYTTTASTIRTASNLEQSHENGITSALLPHQSIMVACSPTTTMFSWESSWVDVIWSSLYPPSFVAAQIMKFLAHKYRFRPTLCPLLVDDRDQWGAVSRVQPPIFVPIWRNLSSRDLEVVSAIASVEF